ncbi:hypothetical protein ABH912_000543 [Pseudomonas sp. BT76 TE3572]|uniref:hypothetical protein n=1 Tax=Pseudomonas sp. BT76 TE3572 TaxID=3349325 RepID=UPI003D1F44C1
MIYTTSSNSKLRAQLLLWSTPLWLSLASVVLISHQVSLSRLGESVQEQTDSVKLQLLEERIIELEQSNLDTPENPNTVTQTEFNLHNDTLSRRIADLRTELAGTAAIADLQVLQGQLQALESKHLQTAPSPAPAPLKLKSRKPNKPPEPTFQIIGRELRGGERFLSINPLGSQSLEQSQVMRIGETYAGWRLRSFDAQAAEFVVDGEIRRLNIR